MVEILVMYSMVVHTLLLCLLIALALGIKPCRQKDKPLASQAGEPLPANGKPPIEKQWEDFNSYDGRPR